MKKDQKRNKRPAPGAAGTREWLNRLADRLGGAGNEYHTFTREEVTALVRGDMDEIEKWAGRIEQTDGGRVPPRMKHEKE